LPGGNGGGFQVCRGWSPSPLHLARVRSAWGGGSLADRRGTQGGQRMGERGGGKGLRGGGGGVRGGGGGAGPGVAQDGGEEADEAVEDEVEDGLAAPPPRRPPPADVQPVTGHPGVPAPLGDVERGRGDGRVGMGEGLQILLMLRERKETPVVAGGWWLAARWLGRVRLGGNYGASGEGGESTGPWRCQGRSWRAP